MSESSKRACAHCFKTLADGTRLQVLHVVQRRPTNVAGITKKAGVTQPTVSYHLKMLDELGLISKKRQGRETVYAFNKNYPCSGCGVFSAPIKI